MDRSTEVLTGARADALRQCGRSQRVTGDLTRVHLYRLRCVQRFRRSRLPRCRHVIAQIPQEKRARTFLAQFHRQINTTVDACMRERRWRALRPGRHVAQVRVRPWSYSSRRLRATRIARHAGRRFALHTAQPETKRWRSHEDQCGTSIPRRMGRCGFDGGQYRSCRVTAAGTPIAGRAGLPGRPRRWRRALARSSRRLPACPPRRSSTPIA